MPALSALLDNRPRIRPPQPLPYLGDPGFIAAAKERFDWPPVGIEVVRVRISPATLQHRLRERGLERDRWKLTHWDDYLRSIDLGLRPRCPHLEIDNGENAAVGLAAQAQRFVSLVRDEA